MKDDCGGSGQTKKKSTSENEQDILDALGAREYQQLIYTDTHYDHTISWEKPKNSSNLSCLEHEND